MEEAKHCLAIGVIDSLIDQPEIWPSFYLFAFFKEGKVVGSAWVTPPHALGITNLPAPCMKLLVDTLRSSSIVPSGIAGESVNEIQPEIEP